MRNKKPIVVHINELANVCGYFNSDTPVNNYYGCNHPESEETEIIQIKDGEERRGEYKEYERKILLLALRKKYGKLKKIIEKVSKTIGGKRYIKKVLYTLMFDNEFLKQFGYKIQGKCYSFSCPLATECNLEDIKKYSKDYHYNDWKDEEYEPHEAGAELMLIRDKNLIKELS